MNTTPLQMRVAKYIPEKMYGFLTSDTSQEEVFFHLKVFGGSRSWDKNSYCHKCQSNCQWASIPPPPILGELVQVEMDASSETPRAKTVTRVANPKVLDGVVTTFDPTRGYGFLQGADGITYHLHRSEVVEGRLPLPGQRVLFFGGSRQGRPRACHVKIC